MKLMVCGRKGVLGRYISSKIIFGSGRRIEIIQHSFQSSLQ